MNQSEFIELHGEEVWDIFVIPLQLSRDFNVNRNANFIAHSRIINVLRAIGLNDVKGILEAKQRIGSISA